MLLLGTLSLSACGYSLAGRGSFLPSYIQTIGVPAFVNRTQVFNLETQLTQKVRSEFIGRGKYKIVPEATNVDALLSGEVLTITATPSGFGTQQLASRYTLRMIASVELRDQRDNKVLWQNPGLLFSEDFDVQSGSAALDPAAFFGQDANAVDRMTTDFAKTIVSAILEAF
jgi:Lipopolysaccharide-assembly